MLLQVAIALVLPLPLRYAVDHLTQTENIDLAFKTLSQIAVLLLALGLAASGLEYLEERLNVRLINSFVTRMRAHLLELTLTRQQSFLDSRRKVDLSGRLVGDVSNLEALIISGTTVCVRSAPTLLLIIAAMFYINASFAALILATLPLFYGLIVVLSQHIKNWERVSRQKQNIFDQDLMQGLQSSALIKSLTGEKAALASLQNRQTEINASNEMTKHYVGLFNSSFSLSRHLLRALVIFVGGWAILQGHMSLGTLFAFVAYLEALNRPIGEISNFISRYGKTHASLLRIEELYQELLPVAETSGTLSPPRNWKLLALDSVCVSHAPAPALFKNLNLKLKRGSLVALAGASGSGKSTFIRLLNRLRDPNSGRLHFERDGIRIALEDVQLSSLRQEICVISQDPFFIAGSIRENLNLALSYIPTDLEIEKALDQVNALEFVREFPLGFETLIGESGLQLSGGQAKRLSLARAFLREQTAQIFVFDEPTSGLDPVSASLVMSSLKSLAQRKSLVLYATHRQEEYRQADEVLLFAAHTDPILSTHHELQQTNFTYKNLLQEDNVVQLREDQP